jgi:hypothetical protein
MTALAACAYLHRSVRRNQAKRVAAATRLRHLPEDPRIAPEHLRDLALVEG